MSFANTIAGGTQRDPAQHHRPARPGPPRRSRRWTSPSPTSSSCCATPPAPSSPRNAHRRSAGPHRRPGGRATSCGQRLADFAPLGGGPLTDLCLFVTETGYVAAPGPFFATTALFAPLLAAIGHDLTPAVLAGETTGTVAMAGADGVWAPNDEPVKCFVPELDRVDWVAIVDAGPTVRVVATDGLPERLLQTVDWSRRLFELDAATVPSGAAVPLDPDALDETVAAGERRAGRRAGRHRAPPLRHGPRVRQAAHPVRRPDRLLPGHPAQVWPNVSLAVERADSAAQYAAMSPRRRRRRPPPGRPRREGRRRHRGHPVGEGQHPGPRRDRLHVGARPAPVPAARLRVGAVAGLDRLAPRPAGRPAPRRLTTAAPTGGPPSRERGTSHRPTLSRGTWWVGAPARGSRR